MLLRCKLDGLLLEARRHANGRVLVAFDGDEGFEMERVEAVYYEVVAARPEDVDWLEQNGYRLLRLAPDFQFICQRLGA
jgi:hypothetical protein